ncbi:Predicted membrane protein [Mycolicibacterium aurum]|uniref:Predicted membrane protein n=1 Tax=Mycolicibacterium aurum TaxID=1791 RepID=A0A448IRK7_MYCAU|nr:YoaK family protein [Mycolicibacterium aurum]VEG55048.1 Predicted membrane protein [Mycolicibacterium aurum]
MKNDRWVVWSMLTLSFTTGILDAATYLGLHGVFTANMTGNLIFISLGITDEATVPVFRAFLALGGFGVGAAAAGRLLRRTETGSFGDWRVGVSVLFVAVVLAACALAHGLSVGSALVLDTLTVALAFAMGVQAMAARRVGVGDVTTVVVTSTLAGLMGENRLTGRSADRSLTSRRALAVATMGVGAVVGALLMHVSVELAIAVPAVLTFCVAAVLTMRARRSTVSGTSARTHSSPQDAGATAR